MAKDEVNTSPEPVDRVMDDNQIAEMVKQYKPNCLDSSVLHIIMSTHNDIAYLYELKATGDFRAEKITGKALDLMNQDDTFKFSMESMVYLREYLERYPERRDEIKKRMEEGRYEFGGTYSQFFEALYGGECLTRQIYFGRKWLKKNFGEGCDSHIMWDLDVPQRTLQMPQVLAKGGIKYIMINRFPVGVFLEKSPDGSSVIIHSFDCTFGEILREKPDWEKIAILQKQPDWEGLEIHPPSRVMKDTFAFLDKWSPFFEEYKIPNSGLTVNPDYAIPNPDVIKAVKTYNKNVERIKAVSKKSPPVMKFSTGEEYMKSIEGARPYLKVYDQDRPNVWGQIHQASHEKMVTAGREGYDLLVNGEKFALIASLLDKDSRPYPQERLNEGWEGLIYPDHGWVGTAVLETMRVFSERAYRAQEIGKDVSESSIRYIAGRVERKRGAGVPIVVFNGLSWKRGGVVSFKVCMGQGEMKAGWMILKDAQGEVIPCQVNEKTKYDDGTVREAEIDFVANEVPSVGYKTYYLCQSAKAVKEGRGDKLRGGVIENNFYRMEFGDRGISRLFDKQLEVEVLKTDKFLGNELFMLGIGGDERSSFYPPDRTIETLENLGKAAGKMKIRQVESGEVKSVIGMEGSFACGKIYQMITLYKRIKRIDLATEIEWDGTKRRDVRLAFGVKLEGENRVSYDVPFGVVEVGKNEMGSDPIIASCVYAQDWPVVDIGKSEMCSIQPREVQNWVDVSNGKVGVTLGVGRTCLNEYRDVTKEAADYPILQPVLLTTLHDFGPKENPWWTQAGRHSYNYCLTSHEGGWQENWRFGWEFNNPLTAVVARVDEDSDQPAGKTYGILPEEYSFCSVKPENIVISTIKKCEDDESVIVRYFDIKGVETEAELKFFRPIKKAEATNIIEEEGKAVASEKDKLKMKSMPFSIDTVKLEIG